jgi:methionyl-tRNA formyltransferase
MDVALYLLGEKGLAVLQGFARDTRGLSACVVVGRDPHVSDDAAAEITALAQRLGCPCIGRSAAAGLVSTYAVAAGWRWMIEGQPGLVVLHDSLLPKLRGFNPLVSALIAGHERIGVTALLADATFDTGDIVDQVAYHVAHPMRIGAAIRLVSEGYETLTSRLVERFAARETLVGTPQRHEEATYSLWRDEDDYWLDWGEDATTLQRRIYALGEPYAGARTLISGRPALISDAELASDVVVENRTPGKVLFVQEGLPTVVCGKGMLKITAARWIDGGDALPLAKYRSRFHHRTLP